VQRLDVFASKRYGVPVRTTLDLPDDVFRKLKARAALEGLSLKDLITRYVTHGLQDAPAEALSDVIVRPQAAPFVSAHDLMKEFCGAFDSGVPDLARNPKHMEGFGIE